MTMLTSLKALLSAMPVMKGAKADAVATADAGDFARLLGDVGDMAVGRGAAAAGGASVAAPMVDADSLDEGGDAAPAMAPVWAPVLRNAHAAQNIGVAKTDVPSFGGGAEVVALPTSVSERGEFAPDVAAPTIVPGKPAAVPVDVTGQEQAQIAPDTVVPHSPPVMTAALPVDQVPPVDTLPVATIVKESQAEGAEPAAPPVSPTVKAVMTDDASPAPVTVLADAAVAPVAVGPVAPQADAVADRAVQPASETPAAPTNFVEDGVEPIPSQNAVQGSDAPTISPAIPVEARDDVNAGVVPKASAEPVKVGAASRPVAHPAGSHEFKVAAHPVLSSDSETHEQQSEDTSSGDIDKVESVEEDAAQTVAQSVQPGPVPPPAAIPPVTSLPVETTEPQAAAKRPHQDVGAIETASPVTDAPVKASVDTASPVRMTANGDAEAASPMPDAGSAPISPVETPAAGKSDGARTTISKALPDVAAISGETPSKSIPASVTPAPVVANAPVIADADMPVAMPKVAQAVPPQGAVIAQDASPISITAPAQPLTPEPATIPPARAEAVSLLQLVRDHMAIRAPRPTDDSAVAASPRIMRDAAPDAAPAMAPVAMNDAGPTPMPSAQPVAQPFAATPPAIPTVDLSASLGAQVVDMGVSGQWIDGLARDIAGLSANGAQGRFQINADQLGPIQVDIRQGDDGAAVSLTVATEAAEMALRQESDRLKLDMGLSSMRISDVKVERTPHVAEAGRPEGAGNQNSGQQQSGGQGQGSGQAAGQGMGQGMGQSSAQSHMQGRGQPRENFSFGHKAGNDGAVLNHTDVGDSADGAVRARYA